MEKTDHVSEPAEKDASVPAGAEEKATVPPVGEDKPVPRKRGMSRIEAIIGFALIILSLELPWLLNKPTVVRTVLLLVAMLAVSYPFGCIWSRGHCESEDNNGLFGVWGISIFAVVTSVAIGIIYLLRPGLVGAWWYLLINFGGALVSAVLGMPFVALFSSDFDGRKCWQLTVLFALTILAAVAAACVAAYFGCLWFRDGSSPILLLLSPVFLIGGSSLAGLVVCLGVGYVWSSLRRKLKRKR